ncbi:MAG: hypothetical protein R3B49_09895 [Phycisphaerales bacterium]
MLASRRARQDASALEALATPGVIFLDKQGTITEGRAGVAAWRGDEALRVPVAAARAFVIAPDRPRVAATDTGELHVEQSTTSPAASAGPPAGAILPSISLAFVESIGARVDDRHWRTLAADAARARARRFSSPTRARSAPLAELGDRVRARLSRAIDRLRACAGGKIPRALGRSP